MLPPVRCSGMTRLTLAVLAACTTSAPTRPATSRSAAAPVREPHAGYDVYRGCGAATAVVRVSGSRSAQTRGALLALFGADLSASPGGGGRPCVRDLAETGFVEIRDPREQELADVGELRLVDPETGRQLRVDTSDRRLRERFAAAAAGERRALVAALASSGVRHVALSTEGDWLRPLTAFLRRKRERA